MNAAAQSVASAPPRIQWLVAALGAAILLGGAVVLGAADGRHRILFLVGGLLAISLYHTAFGFTAAYRNALVHRDVSGIAAQCVMLGAATILFVPILAEG